MMRVVPLIGLDQFLLGVLQGGESLLSVSAKLDASVVGLRRMNVRNRAIGVAKRVPQIGMMNFIGEGNGGDQ